MAWFEIENQILKIIKLKLIYVFQNHLIILPVEFIIDIAVEFISGIGELEFESPIFGNKALGTNVFKLTVVFGVK